MGQLSNMGRRRGARGASVLTAISGIVLSISIVAQSMTAYAATPSKDVAAGSQVGPDLAWMSNVRTACSEYVSTSGSDATGIGTAGAPWRTIKFGVSKLNPGDTLCVNPGTYQESAITLPKAGTAALPIAVRPTTLRSAPGAASSVTIQGTGTAAIFEINTNSLSLSYWLFEDFDLDKQQRNGNGFNLFASGTREISHITIRDNRIYNSASGGGVYVQGRVHDLYIRDNEIFGHQRWRTSSNAIAYTRLDGSYGRADANGVTLQGVVRQDAGGAYLPTIGEVRIEGNTFRNNGGDAVQCLGANDALTDSVASDPVNIDIINNKMINTANLNNPASDAIEENAYDIKSCRQVGIRNTLGAANTHELKTSELLPTIQAYDYPGNNSDGTAIVIHYNARNVLIENLRMSNICSGISIGTAAHKVRNVSIRRNLITAMRFNQGTGYGPAPANDAAQCDGRTVQITNADNVDLYHNTFRNITKLGVEIGTTTGPSNNHIDIWNNIFVLNSSGDPVRWWLSVPGTTTNVNSDHNLFWHDGGGASTSSPLFRDKAYNSGQAIGLTTWRSVLGRDNASFVATPLFFGGLNEYYTQPGSNARDTALNNTGFAGSCGAGPDIGYVESCQ